MAATDPTWMEMGAVSTADLEMLARNWLTEKCYS